MPRYVALLRGVSPMNAKMPALKHCFEAAGFSNVRTLLSSGNVVFDSRAMPAATLERRAEQAMLDGLGRSFDTIVRSTDYLNAFLESEPFAAFALPATAKRIVTFLRTPTEPKLALPIRRGNAVILGFTGAEILSAYEPGPTAPTFMALIERTVGKAVTTRTLDTVRKCACA